MRLTALILDILLFVCCWHLVGDFWLAMAVGTLSRVGYLIYLYGSLAENKVCPVCRHAE